MNYTLEILPDSYSIIKLDQVPDLSQLSDSNGFWTLSVSENEVSLLAPIGFCQGLSNREILKWKVIRFCEVLDFSLKGILAKISGILADSDIGIFVVSTYDTDYILVQEKDINRASSALRKEYTILP